jgi:hypothetical protein
MQRMRRFVELTRCREHQQTMINCSLASQETNNPQTSRKWLTTRVNGHERSRLDRPYRVDVLDRQVLFHGLYYDRRIIAERLAHDPEAPEDAWVLSLGESEW